MAQTVVKSQFFIVNNTKAETFVVTITNFDTQIQHAAKPFNFWIYKLNELQILIHLK
jgi:hypothetical protein